MTRDPRSLEKRVENLESVRSAPERGPDLTDEQARVIRKFDLGIDGDLSPAERRTLEEVL